MHACIILYFTCACYTWTLDTDPCIMHPCKDSMSIAMSTHRYHFTPSSLRYCSTELHTTPLSLSSTGPLIMEAALLLSRSPAATTTSPPWLSSRRGEAPSGSFPRGTTRSSLRGRGHWGYVMRRSSLTRGEAPSGSCLGRPRSPSSGRALSDSGAEGRERFGEGGRKEALICSGYIIQMFSTATAVLYR